MFLIFKETAASGLSMQTYEHFLLNFAHKMFDPRTILLMTKAYPSVSPQVAEHNGATEEITRP